MSDVITQYSESVRYNKYNQLTYFYLVETIFDHIQAFLFDPFFNIRDCLF
jgi:hypothetical protein